MTGAENDYNFNEIIRFFPPRVSTTRLIEIKLHDRHSVSPISPAVCASPL